MPHIHELYDFTVSAYIVFEDKVLLHLHKKLNLWLAVGGHIELDEQPMEALWREVKEEAGLDESQLILVSSHKISIPENKESLTIPPPFDINVHPFNDNHKHIDLAYVLVSNTNEVKPAEGESPEFKWLSPDELDAMKAELVENVYLRCRAALTIAKNITT